MCWITDWLNRLGVSQLLKQSNSISDLLYGFYFLFIFGLLLENSYHLDKYRETMLWAMKHKIFWAKICYKTRLRLLTQNTERGSFSILFETGVRFLSWSRILKFVGSCEDLWATGSSSSDHPREISTCY